MESNKNKLIQEMVVLVDEFDNEVGTLEKLEAHLMGKLHRAVSVFLFNDQGQMLLQQRAFSKYHSRGLWTNTCCSHPRPGEDPLDAAMRRLFEEMGICCKLDKVLDFIYKTALDNDLIEHEFDHVFVGRFNGQPIPNSDEAASWKWVHVKELLQDVAAHSEQYTSWFKIILGVTNKTYLNLPDQPSFVRNVEK